MKLVIGLGNPGDDYVKTRHNIGFMVADSISKANGITVNQTKFKSIIGRGAIGSEDVIIAKPQTYMNRSGESVSSLLFFYKLEPSDCIVICDDLELPSGKIRVRGKGGHGGHNGLRSIIEQTGSQEFVRVRVGIGRPNDASVVSNYVLNPFSKDEKPLIEDAIEKASRAVEAIIADGVDAAMNKFN
ncbi:MAG TPA: aminoacyl-tRNA hydrolase [Thermodesulfobacteriota bacterium]|nr:aminoacyl-tRNA hydrolase [Thermodesulfobacteriota bacterium]